MIFKGYFLNVTYLLGWVQSFVYVNILILIRNIHNLNFFIGYVKKPNLTYLKQHKINKCLNLGNYRITQLQHPVFKSGLSSMKVLLNQFNKDVCGLTFLCKLSNKNVLFSGTDCLMLSRCLFWFRQLWSLLWRVT